MKSNRRRSSPAVWRASPVLLPTHGPVSPVTSGMSVAPAPMLLVDLVEEAMPT